MTEQQQEFAVAILGAGLGGLGMGMRLTQSGEHSFVILEKAGAVGGTWRDNTYPGASCDIRSHLYWFSFDAQPDWSRVYAFQPEIQANIERLVDRLGLRRHIRLNTEVTGAHWDGSAWVVEAADGSSIRARSLVTAWGQLNRPTFRDIPGRDDFRGDSWHSAGWNHDVDLTGKKVACIGNGASAVQLIPDVAAAAGELTVFQRTANYVVPRDDRPYEPGERTTFLEQPDALQASRDSIYWEHEGWMGAMKQGTPVAEEFTTVARGHLEAQIADPELREKLWPDYPIGCKRIIIADTFYPAMAGDNVHLVTEKIEGVEPTGVRTADGVLHEVDVIVYATGFETLSFNAAMPIVGRDGVTLGDAWRDGPQAYLGVTVAGFPNFFMLYGPNTNLGHNSILQMLECQYDYVLQALDLVRAAGAVEVKPEVQERFNADLQAELADSSFAGSCNSWYKTADGKITNNWMGSVEDYRAATAELDREAYAVRPG